MDNIEIGLEQLLSAPSGTVDPMRFFMSVSLSILVSAIVIGLYRKFYSRPRASSDVQRTFLLLGPSITALFLVIQFSIPMSLGLFGVFAIIRFRNPVRDSEEIGFLMLLLASAVICATLNIYQLVMFLVLVTIALFSRQWFRKLIRDNSREGLYVLSLSLEEGVDVEAQLMAALESSVPDADVQSLSYGGGLLTVHCRFSGEAAPSAAVLSRALEEVVSVRQIDIFYADSSTIV